MAKREKRKRMGLIFIGTVLFLLSTVCTHAAEKSTTSYSVSKNNTVSYKGNFYKAYNLQYGWNKAEAYCESLGGHLVTISTADEQNVVYSLAHSAGKNCYWIGTNKTLNYSWVTGEKMSYANWVEGEPDDYNGNQGYVFLCGKNLNSTFSAGKWSDLSEDGSSWDNESFWGISNFGFICEWDAPTVEDKLLEFEVGDTGVINYSVSGSGTVTFKSSNTSVAKVSSKGKVIAKGSGVCKITVKYKGASQKVVVVVSPKKVSSLKKRSVTAKMVQLKWKALSGVSGYQVWMYDPDVEEYVKVKTTRLNSATVTGLDRRTKYKFKVRAYVKYGKKYYYGAYSKTITITTKR